MTEKESIIALLRACVNMSPARCHETLKQALKQMDAEKLRQAVARATGDE